MAGWTSATIRMPPAQEREKPVSRRETGARLRVRGYFAVTEKAFVTKFMPPDDEVIS